MGRDEAVVGEASERSSSYSLSDRLKRFAQWVLKKSATPLLPLPTKIYDTSSGKLPMRSRRIAAQPLANIPVAKQGEALIMQSLGTLQGRLAESAKQEYEAMFTGNLEPSHVAAM